MEYKPTILIMDDDLAMQTVLEIALREGRLSGYPGQRRARGHRENSRAQA